VSNASDDRFQRDFAAERSHQDAEAANQHTKSLDQLIFVLNGAAATAILTFASKATVARDSTILVVLALGCFAFGAASGAAAMRAHARALYEWLYFWSLRAGVSDYEKPPTNENVDSALRDALLQAAGHDLSYRLSIVFFLAGCFYFGVGVLNAASEASSWHDFVSVAVALVSITAVTALGYVLYRYRRERVIHGAHRKA
jgi:hypothetical protein